ncbi:hypothetical protein ACG3SL_09855 [Sphingomonas sp. CJ20]
MGLPNVPAMLADTIRTRGRGIKNLFARSAGERVVVLESDDWGSQRVPSLSALRRLIAAEVLTGENPYDRDTLETAADLEALLDVLDGARGSDGRRAAFNCYVNPANPDFDAIRDAEYSAYSWEPLGATLDRRGDRGAVFAAWRTGMAEGMLIPEYHGREHLNVTLWMKHLRRASPMVRAGFDHRFYSAPEPSLPPAAKGFRAAYFFSDHSEIPLLEDILHSGAVSFREQFGRSAGIFCPTNNIFHPKLYGAVRRAGCRGIIRHVRNVEPDGRGGVRRVWGAPGLSTHALGSFGRNTIFEPALGYGVDHALAGIRSAFAWGTPAIVSTHRLNYVGGIDPAVRDKGLFGLRALLGAILARWPDVRFATSASLLSAEAGA